MGSFKMKLQKLKEKIESELPNFKRKRGRPPGSKSAHREIGRAPAGAQSVKSKMEQKMALVNQRLALLDSASSSSSSGGANSDKDDDWVPIEDELDIAISHQPVVLHCGDTDDEDEVIPLEVVKPRRLHSEQKKLPGAPQAQNAQNIITGVIKIAKASDINGQNISASVHSNCGSAMARAEEVQAKLPAEHPSFIKKMLQSHVVRGFWLGLPARFCYKHLPEQDTEITLEDENGEEHSTLYLGGKQGLSAGWRGFAIRHNVKVGDVVVFQLVRPTKFKVYIIRANKFTAADGAISLLNLEVCKKGEVSSEGEPSDAIEATTVELEHKVPGEDDDGNDNNNVMGNLAADGLRISDSETKFGDVRSFSDFSVVVDSLVIDCKFKEHQRRTYYELCQSQKAFLHKQLVKQLNLTLVVGVIMETISIAEGIRAGKARPSDLLVWKKTLESVALLGMDVGFLLTRVDNLLAVPAAQAEAQAKYREVKMERDRTAEKVKALELALGSVKEGLRKIDADMEEVQASVKRSGTALEQLATAPW